MSCSGFSWEGGRVLSRVLRRGSKKGPSRREEAETRLFGDYDPLCVCPAKVVRRGCKRFLGPGSLSPQDSCAPSKTVLPPVQEEHPREHSQEHSWEHLDFWEHSRNGSTFGDCPVLGSRPGKANRHTSFWTIPNSKPQVRSSREGWVGAGGVSLGWCCRDFWGCNTSNSQICSLVSNPSANQPIFGCGWSGPIVTWDCC